MVYVAVSEDCEIVNIVRFYLEGKLFLTLTVLISRIVGCVCAGVSGDKVVSYTYGFDFNGLILRPFKAEWKK